MDFSMWAISGASDEPCQKHDRFNAESAVAKVRRDVLSPIYVLVPESPICILLMDNGKASLSLPASSLCGRQRTLGFLADVSSKSEFLQFSDISMPPSPRKAPLSRSLRSLKQFLPEVVFINGS
jgi:hypothetical protein